MFYRNNRHSFEQRLADFDKRAQQLIPFFRLFHLILDEFKARRQAITPQLHRCKVYAGRNVRSGKPDLRLNQAEWRGRADSGRVTSRARRVNRPTPNDCSYLQPTILQPTIPNVVSNLAANDITYELDQIMGMACTYRYCATLRSIRVELRDRIACDRLGTHHPA